MPRPLGPLQNKLLAALRRHGRDTTLEGLAALSAGLIPDLDARPPYGRAPTRSEYVSTARAVAALRRRGLIHTEVAATSADAWNGLKTSMAGFAQYGGSAILAGVLSSKQLLILCPPKRRHFSAVGATIRGRGEP